MTQQANESSIVGKNEKSKSSWNISCILKCFLSCNGGNSMKYTFTITDEDGKASEIKEMSWKKLLKKLSGKTCWVSYVNKKGNSQTKVVEKGKEKRD